VKRFTKPSPGLVAEFKGATENIRDALPRKMFGYDCIFVNGHFAAGLWQNTAVFKLSDADGARFVTEAGAVPFSPMEGRPMKNWWEASEEIAHDGEQLAAWCDRAAAFARTQPPKTAKPRKTAKPTKAPARARAKNR
jgi:TfoX/Sxy family transcriptional regulator of competence genes